VDRKRNRKDTTLIHRKFKKVDQNLDDSIVAATDNIINGAGSVKITALASSITIDTSSVLRWTVDTAGNLVPAGTQTVDGRDLSVDGTKLDGIEAGADVTDETNVLSALDGATITNVAVATGDKVLFQDVDDSDNIKYDTAQNIANTITDAQVKAKYENNSNTNAFTDSEQTKLGNITLANTDNIVLPSYTVAGLPSAGNAGAMIFVTDETGGAIPAFDDGTNWRRVTDRAIVS